MEQKTLQISYKKIEPNILLVDKPKGITSFDVIRRLRRELGVRKMGHAGTLDPLASGLLIVAIGDATKKLDQFLKLPKAYRADILLGKKTTTGDLEGEIIEQSDVPTLDQDTVSKIVKDFAGEHLLPVPLYSAVKVDGKSLYKYAREGKTPPRIPEKKMEVIGVKLLDYNEKKHIVTLRLSVSSGTYIRSLAEEFGRRLDLPAVLADLQRISIGDYSLESSLTTTPSS